VSGSGTPGGTTRRRVRRRWLTGEDEDNAIRDLRAWFREHPNVTDPEAAIKALGLPDMTGVPADPKARTKIHWRMHRDAKLILQHAGYAMRHEAGLRQRGESPAQGSGGRP
jgi:hypothetical protein